MVDPVSHNIKDCATHSRFAVQGLTCMCLTSISEFSTRSSAQLSASTTSEMAALRLFTWRSCPALAISTIAKLPSYSPASFTSLFQQHTDEANRRIHMRYGRKEDDKLELLSAVRWHSLSILLHRFRFLPVSNLAWNDLLRGKSCKLQICTVDIQ